MRTRRVCLARTPAGGDGHERLDRGVPFFRSCGGIGFHRAGQFCLSRKQPSEGIAEPSGEFAAAEPLEAEGFFGAEEAAAEPVPAEEAAMEPELAGEGVADLELAEGLAEGEEPKPKFTLPPWVRTAEWVAVGLLAAGALLAVVISVIWVKNPARVTLMLNIGCPLMLGLIPYALWRSMDRWVSPAISAIYTVMLALSTAALVAGTWFIGLELARYDWQYSRTRVAAGKPPRVNIEPRAPVEISSIRCRMPPSPRPNQPQARTRNQPQVRTPNRQQVRMRNLLRARLQRNRRQARTPSRPQAKLRRNRRLSSGDLPPQHDGRRLAKRHPGQAEGIAERSRQRPIADHLDWAGRIRLFVISHRRNTALLDGKHGRR